MNVFAETQSNAQGRRFRRLRGVIIVAALVAALPLAAEPLNQPHARSDTPNQSSSPEVAAAQRKVADLEKQLHALQTRLTDLKAQEPQAPGAQAGESERKKYKQDHAKWQSQVDKVTHQIDAVKTKLDVAKKELEAAKAGQPGAH